MARRALDMAAETGAEAVIWGGDFNMESRSRSMAAILDRGFEHVSGGEETAARGKWGKRESQAPVKHFDL